MTTRRQSNNQETILRSNWDNSGIDFKAFTVEVTDTASGPNSTVMDLRVDGISVGSLGKDGSLILPTPLPVASGGTGTDNNTDARTNLGLGSISTQDSGNVSITGGSITGIADLAIADGGTGASTAADARTNLGLGSISTQDSSNILITGGSITGITDLAIADGGTGASTAADARDNLVVVHRAGDTMTGDLTVGDGTAGFSVNIDGANSTDRSLTYLTNGSLRWEIVTNSDSESGLNEGSNFNLRRYNDAGSLIGNSINISRSTGDTTFENDIAVGDGFTMQPDATFSLGVKGLKTTSRSLQYFSGTTLRWEVLTNNSPEEDLTSPSIPTKLADPASLPTGNGWSVAFSPDGVHMAVAHFTSPFIAIYERSGNTFTKLANPATLPAGDARSAAFSPDGKHLVVAHAVSPFITIYERVGNTFTKLPNPATLPPDTGRSVSFSPDGKHLVVGHALTPHVTIYERSGNTFTKVADPAILPPNTVNGVAFSPDGNHLVAVHFDSPFLTIYERSGNTFTKLADPATAPASTGFAVAFSPNNTHMVVGHDVAPRITIYKISGNTFTKLPDPSSIPSGDVRGVAFSSDDIHMVATHLLSPFITVYERAGDTFTKLPDPSSLPTGTGRGATFSPDAGFMPIAHDTIPFITIYDSPVGVNTNGGSDFSIKRYGDGGTVIGEPIKIARETGLMSLQGLTSVESGGFTLSDGGIAPSDANVSFGIDGVNATNRTIEYFTGDDIRWKIEVNNSPEEDPTAPAVATKLADPATLPAGAGQGTTFSPDGIHLAVTHDTTPFITIYERSGNTFTKLADPSTLPTFQGRDVAFSPDGVHLAVATESSPSITIYERSGNTFTKLANPSILPPSASLGVSFSPDGVHLAVASFNSPFLTIYERSGNTFTKVADPATLPPGAGRDVDFSPDGTHMAVGHGGSPFVTIYERSGNTFTKLADPAILPTGAGFGVAFSLDGTHLAVATFTTPFITIYERSGNTFTKLADPAVLPTNVGRRVAFSPDGTHLAVSHASSPFITIYERSGNTFTKLADPATLPTGTGLGISFSSDGTHLAVAHDISPFITIYDSPVGVNTNGGSDFSIKRYGDNGAIIGEPLKISRETGDTVFKDGNVGIDANSPSEKLQVKSGNILLDNNFSLLGFNPAGTFSRNLIKFDSANNLIIGDLSTSIINNTIIASGNGAGKSITLFTSAAERMRITDTGRVGIGATGPASKLEVVGTITSTGLNVNNNLITNVATPVSATDAANKDYVDSTTANLANWELVTTNIAAENGDRLLVDTSSSSITVTMPASPVLGDEVRFADKAGTFASNNLTIARNGSPIQGLLEDLVVDVNNVDFALVFTNATDGWRLSDVSNIVTGADPATTTVFQFTATAGQTVFTGLDDNGFGLVYTPGFEVVFLNGVKLEFADYVRTDSNTITLVEAAAVDDVLTVLAFGTFDIANVYTQAEADAAFVAQGELPSPAVADTYLRRNTANTAYEAESSLDVSNDLITSRDWRGKNAIINGNFDIWQRGTSFPITTGVTILTADRWSSTAQQGGTGAATVTRQDFPPGFTDVPGNPRFYLRHDQTIATSASTGYVVQKIESVRTFAGQTVTFSFWGRDLSGPTTFAPFIIQNFGTGGSPSTSVFLEFSPFVVTTSFQRFEITINVPSIVGKTVGTAGNDHIQFGILQSSTTGFTTFTLDFAQAQVELGTVATSFERRHFQEELALCQRYFEKTYSLETPPGTATTVGNIIWQQPASTVSLVFSNSRFMVSKRASPAVIWYSTSTGASGNVRDDSATTDRAVVGTSNQNENQTGFASVSAAPSDQAFFRAQWTAEAEL